MDPVKNLEEQRELADRILNPDDHGDGDLEIGDLAESWKQRAVELAELVQALDEWRKNGGYDPYKS
jgi:hypothetical protein